MTRPDPRLHLLSTLVFQDAPSAQPTLVTDPLSKRVNPMALLHGLISKTLRVNGTLIFPVLIRSRTCTHWRVVEHARPLDQYRGRCEFIKTEHSDIIKTLTEKHSANHTFNIQILVSFNVARTIHCVRNCN